MLLTPYYPFKEMENRLFGNRSIASQENVSTFTPNVNTREGEFAYHIDIDLPGVKKEDIKVDLKENVITISGERRHKEEISEKDFYRVETRFGKFSRSFTLPDDADIENIDASTDSGVLEVVIPKLAKPKGVKTIEVK